MAVAGARAAFVLNLSRTRQLLTAVDSIVSAGLINGPGGVQDLVVTCAAPEVNLDITGSPSGAITLTGLTQQYLGTSGLVGVQTDINLSGQYSETFTPTSTTGFVRDLKVQLQGDDSMLTIGDPSDAVTVGRDLIVSMPANTTAAELTKSASPLPRTVPRR